MRDKKSPIIVAIAISIVIVCLAFLLKTDKGNDDTSTASTSLSVIEDVSSTSGTANGAGKNAGNVAVISRTAEVTDVDVDAESKTSEKEEDSEKSAKVEREEKQGSVTENNEKNVKEEKNVNNEQNVSQVVQVVNNNAQVTPTQEPAKTSKKDGSKSEKSSAYDNWDLDSKAVLNKIRNAEVGSQISLGGIDQDDNNDNGDEAIDWIVLDKNDSATLITTVYAIEGMNYYESQSPVTWEDSRIRDWLNSDFYDKCFSDAEKEYILSATIPADANPDYDTNCGNATTDKVFLLSYKEASNYFGSESIRRCQPTDHAVSKGVLYNENYGTTWWWLRTAGDSEDKTAVVNSDGTLTSNGCVHGTGAVRPAMWIRNNDDTDLTKITIAGDEKEESGKKEDRDTKTDTNTNTKTDTDIDTEVTPIPDTPDPETETTDLSVVYNAYADYLETNDLVGFGVGQYTADENSQKKQIVYSLAYIDGDDIPELVYAETNPCHADCAYILKYVDGRVELDIPKASNFGSFEYYEKKNLVYSLWQGGGGTFEAYEEISEAGTLRTICNMDRNDTTNETDYYVSDQLVCEDEYTDLLYNMLPDQETITWSSQDNESQYTYLNASSIEELRTLR